MTKTIISLTSIPTRINRIGPVIESLKSQTASIDAIILWVPRQYRRKEFRDAVLPDLGSGIEVRYCDTDYGPATKVLPAVKAFADEDIRIIYCDDDEIYEPTWAETLIRGSEEYPDACIALSGLTTAWIDRDAYVRSWRYRALNSITFNLYQRLYRRMNPVKRPGVGPVDICQGFGGVLVRPQFFGPEVFDIPDVLWTVDDIWLSGHLATRGVKIHRVLDHKLCSRSDLTRVDDLTSYSVDNFDRIDANAKCVAYYREKYGVW